ncbi:Eco57I restriction-modification methylase domain-containing protein [Chryseobacterium sp. G0201]|uniref:Eco57I restriction-modification methylase domain-containing protein n=1 Tax=Chryseobacterium sp. G0201 TaxID=2487065 RepID=UPI000F4D38A4|nr:TaqI-like C-terminal specificity domain-containing protein [Chryseobacterium sp. G0201]AZA54591.1 restriction endonuclease subunit M [Chryseobacterium sp. G0201]
MKLKIFKDLDFIHAIRSFFKDLNVPMNYISDKPTTAIDMLQDFYKANDTFDLIDDVYFAGIVDDASFRGNESLSISNIKSDYDGILIFGITIKNSVSKTLPTRSQLAEITRTFNRAFYCTPVVIIFKYDNYLAFANSERSKYKQSWREGEKVGKVRLLRDIQTENTHSGHIRILEGLKLPTTGSRKVDSFSSLYIYWQEVFNVSLLNKKFYQELSTWYFWATKHVIFPGAPTESDVISQNVSLKDLVQEHNATNVIRMLTRLLFVWFIREKKLIPEELFNLDSLQKDILKKIEPYHEHGLFTERNLESVYYKAILQNLFFATLNCPIESESIDRRQRGFRGEGYGTNRGIDYLMRYKQHFKDPEAFLSKVNKVVPFLNGGLFECLDDKFNNLYVDGFSDQMIKGEQLVVPDYLFFGLEEEEDISDIIGINDKKYKKAAVKGLINILKSYKFTIIENTPIEEDVALDPELLGKVFENLLASYNPETKTTARKQTGSFYTPREVVNYMVDETLVSYLKRKIKEWDGLSSESIDSELRDLISFGSNVPFVDSPELKLNIINALSTCTIFDPACGSGAFPMGALQKMVHILQKLDPDNRIWKQIQETKAKKEAEEAFDINDKSVREQRLIEINEAFDQNINDPDYARKLFLIENSIYGVDIQPIATQISKLRFFISLVVEQKVNPNRENFGIRPLPNLETKFVTANTLIDIEKEGNLFSTDDIKILELQLKDIRSKLFGARTKETKLKYRSKDKALRELIAEKLKSQGLPVYSAEKLANWDPFDQNSTSSFFDPEWMFDIKDGFDIIIGNPPYKIVGADESREQSYYRERYKMASYKINLYVLFLENGLDNLDSTNGCLSFIIPKSLVFNTYLNDSRTRLLEEYAIPKIVEINERVFENVEVGDNIIFFGSSDDQPLKNILEYQIVKQVSPFDVVESFMTKQADLVNNHDSNFYPKLKIENLSEIQLDEIAVLSNGLNPGNVKHILISESKISEKHQKMVLGKDIKNYNVKWSGTWVNYDKTLKNSLTIKDIRSKSGMVAQKKVDFALRNPNIYVKNKILVRKTSDHIIAAYDRDGYYFDSLAYGIQLKESTKLSIYYILGLLNSKFVNHFHQKISLNKGKVFAKVLLKNLASIPIRNINFDDAYEQSIHDVISEVAFYLVHTNDSNVHEIFQSIIDSLILELYFGEHMKENNIDVYKYIKDDFIHQNFKRDIDDSNLPGKINNLYSKYSHPDNEVINRFKLFSVRSPEILKPIMES